MPAEVYGSESEFENEPSVMDMTVLDLAVVLAKHKRLILGLPLLTAIAAFLVGISLPPSYTATARILPPQQNDATAAAMLGALTQNAPSVSQALGVRTPNDLYVGILRSRTIADQIINRFQLKEEYKSSNMFSTRTELASVSHISSGKDGLITIDVEDRDPKRAADLANAYVEELDRLMQTLAVTDASQRRLFFEKQLAVAREKLATVEASLTKAIDAKGITGVDIQTRAVVATTERLRADISAREIQLNSMASFATEQNPDTVRLRAEIASMKSELASLERGRGGMESETAPTGLANARRLRDVRFLEFTVQLLAKQYESAKIDEAKQAVLIQLVDRAVPPDYQSNKKKILFLVITAAFLGAIVAALWAVIAERFASAALNPRKKAQLEMLRRLLWRATANELNKGS